MLRRILLTISLVVILLTNTTTGLAQGSAPGQAKKPELAEHVPGEILIRFSPGMNSAQAVDHMSDMGVTHKREISAIGVHLVKLPPGLSVEKAMDRFSRRPGVEFVEPNYILQVQVPASVVVDQLDQWALEKIEAPLAWDQFGPDPNEPLLAVVDTGITFDHPDLAANVWENPGETGLDDQGADKSTNGIDDDTNGYVDDWQGWDFVNNDNEPLDDNMHGTAISSVAAGEENGIGVVGVCPWCPLLGVKVLDSTGSGTLDAGAAGIIYAADMGARVINLSLGAGSGTQTLADAVAYAWNAGAVVSAAAGNNGARMLFYPAAYPEAMAVASTDEADHHSCFSNFSPDFISVAAPGSAVVVADITNQETGYGYYNGTSLSAPHVTGLAGLLFSQDPGRTNDEVRSIIEESAVDLGPSGTDAAFGFGRIDAYRAVTGDYSQVPPPDGLFSMNDSATGYAHARKLVRDGTGMLHLIWHTDDGSTYRIRYANSTDEGTTWNLMPDVYSSPNETYHSALATDGTYLYAAIPSKTEPGASDYYQILFTRRLLPDGDWEAALPIMGGDLNTVRPDMYFDPTNGQLHVIASSLDDAPDLYYRGYDTQTETWGDLKPFNPSNSTQNTRYATLHANGPNIFIATRTIALICIFGTCIPTGSYIHSARSTNSGVDWNDNDKEQISSFESYSPSDYGISLAGVGDRLYMGYEVGRNMYFRRYDGAWSDYFGLEASYSEPDPSNPLNTITYSYKWPTITQAENGQAWLMYEKHKESALYGVLQKQQVLRHYVGGTWSETESMGSSTYANFKLGTEADKIEWLQTGCNGAPFEVVYGSRSVSSNTPPVAHDQNVVTDEDIPVDITLTGSDQDGNNLTFNVVTGPANGTLSGTAPVLTYSPDPDYNGPDSFTFVANDGIEDSLPATISITINSVNDFPGAEFSASPTSGAAPLTVSFSDLSTGTITSRLWDFGDGGSSTMQNPSYEYTNPGIYPVSLTVSGPAGSAIETKADYITVTDLIFEDSFEDGTLDAWSSSVGTGLSVSPTAAMIGSYGLQALIDDTTPLYVRDDTPTDESRYRARFYFDPNSISMSSGDQFYILSGRSANLSAFNLYFRYYNGLYQVRVAAVDDSLVYKFTAWNSLTDEPHFIEVDWAAASAPAANDGYISLYIDGDLKSTRALIDSDTRRIDQVLLGPWAGIDSGTIGTLYFDAFESHHQDYIGP